ncbi:hypothetical protein V8F06_000337 [Rhypophila decipiens]
MREGDILILNALATQHRLPRECKKGSCLFSPSFGLVLLMGVCCGIVMSIEAVNGAGKAVAHTFLIHIGAHLFFVVEW